MAKKQRDIRIVGKRRAFDAGRFVVAIVAHAEAMAEAEAEAEAQSGQADQALTANRQTGDGPDANDNDHLSDGGSSS